MAHTKTNRSFKRKLTVGILSAAAAAAAVILFFLFTAREQLSDFRRLSSETYDTVFLSMFPSDTYEEEPFLHYRGMNVIRASHDISSASQLSRYMECVAKSGNVIQTVYLGIRPDKITLKELEAILLRYPPVKFEVILAYPSASYWAQLSRAEYEKTLEAYSLFLSEVPSAVSGNYYFWASTPWLVENPGNYETPWLVNTDIARTIMLNSDTDHGYLVTEENVSALSQALAENTASYRDSPKTFPDLSDYEVILFGDSVIGNYTDSSSIPGVVAGLTGAAVYNCGYGGGRAARSADEKFSLTDFVDAFFRGDPGELPEDKPIRESIAAYSIASHENKKQVFVINFGINDYYVGSPVCGEDPRDVSTFAGALRSAAETIRAQIPGAQIILCTPNLTFRFDYGEEPLGPEGEKFSDYADTVKKVAAEMGLDVLDNFYELGITPENIGFYLEYDLVHPNANGRFIIGSRLARLIR